MVTRRHVLWVFVFALILAELFGWVLLRDAWESRQQERKKKADARAAASAPPPEATLDRSPPLPALSEARPSRAGQNKALVEP